MRIACLIKQIPVAEELSLGADMRLRRDVAAAEMNPYCRRAVAKAVELAKEHHGTTTVFSLGPPAAVEVLREALACGVDRAVQISDLAFAGSDTLATARALVAALRRTGTYDLILAGLHSVDADTGQVGPQVAELLGLPFLSAVRELDVSNGRISRARCEREDGWVELAAPLPAVISCAERLCDPAKGAPADVAAVDGARVERLNADDLGPGPWGAPGSPTTVDRIEQVASPTRLRRVFDATVREGVDQVGAAIVAAQESSLVVDQVALRGHAPAADGATRVVTVLQPDQPAFAREILGVAAELAGPLGASVQAVVDVSQPDPSLSQWGADEVLAIRGSAPAPEDLAEALASYCVRTTPPIVLIPATQWGREVGARLAARLGAGLTGDATDLELHRGRLVAWKPALGGSTRAAITSSSRVQIATVRPGAGVPPRPRPPASIPYTEFEVSRRDRVTTLGTHRDDDAAALRSARAVVAIGQGVSPDDYPLLAPLLDATGGVLGATRKVTDRGWLPRSRQIGITGLSIAPPIYISIGVSGRFNHVVGVRHAGLIVAVDVNAAAAVFEHCDFGLVGDWRDVVGALVDAMTMCQLRAGASSHPAGERPAEDGIPREVSNQPMDTSNATNP